MMSADSLLASACFLAVGVVLLVICAGKCRKQRAAKKHPPDTGSPKPIGNIGEDGEYIALAEIPLVASVENEHPGNQYGHPNEDQSQHKAKPTVNAEDDWPIQERTNAHKSGADEATTVPEAIPNESQAGRFANKNEDANAECKSSDNSSKQLASSNECSDAGNACSLEEQNSMHEELITIKREAVVALRGIPPPPSSEAQQRSSRKSTRAEADSNRRNPFDRDAPELPSPEPGTKSSSGTEPLNPKPNESIAKVDEPQSMDINHNVTFRRASTKKSEPVDVVSRICKSLEQSVEAGREVSPMRRSYADVAKKSNIPVPKARSSVRKDSNGSQKSGIPVAKSPRSQKC